MTPELEVVLASIGWRYVQAVAPWKATFLARDLNATGGLFAPDDRTAKDLHAEHQQLMHSVAIVLRGLSAMPADVALHVNVCSCAPELRDAGIPDRVSEATSALEVLVEGLIEAERVLTWEMGEPKRGRQLNKAALRVAEAVAEIYVIGTGLKPTAGRRADGKGSSGKFCLAVERVFKVLGIFVGDSYRPCQNAVNQMSDERISELLAIRTRKKRLPLWR